MQIIQINPRDNVAVALSPLDKGEKLVLKGRQITLNQPVPKGHKLALEAIPAGADVVKYGHRIGRATAALSPGDWVHTQNMQTALSEQQGYVYRPDFQPLPTEGSSTSALPGASSSNGLLSGPSAESEGPKGSFQGYLRRDGRAGVRNEIWILPLVGCVNDVCQELAAMACGEPEGVCGVDGIYAFPHPYGCSQLGEDHENTRKILAKLCRHPNAGGVLVVGLGCENNTMEAFQTLLGDYDPERIRFMVCQEVADELVTGQELLEELLGVARRDRRETVPMRKLVVGMKCGGSDGLSGITANPVVGAFSDRLIARGGSTILTEVPEMFGAEEMLMNRCVSKEVFRDLEGMVQGFKDYFTRHGQTVYENPSPGNKDGGITTLEDKSLGCVQKGGSAPVVDVLDYGASVKKTGLSLLYGPGNDLVSATALTAAGAQIILFTTGRGTPFGAPAVTLKLSSNSELAERKPDWIDFDAGAVVRGASIAEEGARLLALVQEVADGKRQSKAEDRGYRGIAIFKNGVTL